uniref:Cadherin domain-containing protein n=1 Tax=Branchiostoma floridae TaxID=7739 RepID=C3ZRL4_BRAFL|eukprot:XP_002588803.1 hypothetical protein BRAFLDRAFT_89766 [Branchiostoma floridae]
MPPHGALFVLLIYLVTDCVLGTLQLSANVPENAHVGEIVTSVRSAIGKGREEVRCEIVAGDKSRRFLVTDCVIHVARPLDYGVDPSYNLTVNVTGSSGNPEQLYVDVQVQDVEEYPPVYNDTCEMPVRTEKGKSDLSFDIKLTMEAVGEEAGVVSVSKYVDIRRKSKPSSFSEFYVTGNSDCVLNATWGLGHYADIRTVESLWQGNLTCLYCYGPPDDASVLVAVIFDGRRHTKCDIVDKDRLFLPAMDSHFIVTLSADDLLSSVETIATFLDITLDEAAIAAIAEESTFDRMKQDFSRSYFPTKRIIPRQVLC